MRLVRLLIGFLGGTVSWLQAGIFVLPTPNPSIFQPGAETEYFTPTPGRDWISGTFGCVRTSGTQMHEGIDIKCVERDRNHEPTDAIFAAAAGKVAYVNAKSGMSNYGKYLILEHEIEGIAVYTTYAHLSSFEPGLAVGRTVSQGERIATMGRTTNTRTPITKDRAHLHFEICLRVNPRFATWHTRTHKGTRNDHGDWNGKNLLGLDPRAVLLAQNDQQEKFRLLQFIRSQPVLCRVLIRDANFPWLREYTPLVRRNPAADQAGAVGYEVALDFNGVPIELIPRTAVEAPGKSRFQLLSVNEQVQADAHCRGLVTNKSGNWELTPKGLDLLELLAF